MDASQYKDYILTLLFVKYVTDKFKGVKYADITVPEGGSFDDLVALKGNKNIGEEMDKVIAKLAEAGENNLRGVIDNAHFNDEAKLGSGKEMVDKLTGLIAIFQRDEFNFKKNKASGLTIRTYTYDDYAQFIPEGRDIPITRPDKEFRSLSVGNHKLAVFYKLPIEFVHDSGFSAEDYIAKRMAKNVSNAENRAFLLGDGVIEPTGLLNDDGGAEVGVISDVLSYDSIVDLFFSVKPEHRKKAVWIMNDKTALALRKLKDESGFPLWNGNNDTILGKPVYICNEMPDADAGEKCILFGDFSYYWIIDRNPVCLKILQELFAIRGQIGYIGTEFIDGKLIRSEAVKVLKIAENK